MKNCAALDELDPFNLFDTGKGVPTTDEQPSTSL